MLIIVLFKLDGVFILKFEVWVVFGLIFLDDEFGDDFDVDMDFDVIEFVVM